MDINQVAADFSLPDEAGFLHSLASFRGKIVVINFWSAECPWSARADQYLHHVGGKYPGKVAILNISSNQNETLEQIQQSAREHDLPFVLLDQNCKVADAWGALTTPHIFVLDEQGFLRYRGAIDDVTFRKRTPDHFFVEDAINSILDQRIPQTQETPSYGCTIVRMV